MNFIYNKVHKIQVNNKVKKVPTSQLFFFSSIFSIYYFFANCCFWGRQHWWATGFSGSPPVVFSMYCKMCYYSDK